MPEASSPLRHLFTLGYCREYLVPEFGKRTLGTLKLFYTLCEDILML
jgi:hypothetical protein